MSAATNGHHLGATILADLEQDVTDTLATRATVDLTGADDPIGPTVHQVVNHVESFRWLLSELGRRGLAGVFLRGEVPVFCVRVGEDGYLPSWTSCRCSSTACAAASGRAWAAPSCRSTRWWPQPRTFSRSVWSPATATAGDPDWSGLTGRPCSSDMKRRSGRRSSR
ncbi:MULTISPECIES: hypothetical protein [unclassified Pseudonocardia]|uniref:hypothetical protein n=1 Tax=unclassified Pseudonocardia TaxID=2619320 RepID=UPI000A5B8D3F|nr:MULTISPECIES: hypothetical protein [unclassified Pseudonocardia]